MCQNNKNNSFNANRNAMMDGEQGHTTYKYIFLATSFLFLSFIFIRFSFCHLLLLLLDSLAFSVLTKIIVYPFSRYCACDNFMEGNTVRQYRFSKIEFFILFFRCHCVYGRNGSSKYSTLTIRTDWCMNNDYYCCYSPIIST